MDGVDARLFRALEQRLGSEERARDCIILMGLLEKIRHKRTRVSTKRIEVIRSSFDEIVGISYPDFESLIETL